MGCLISTDPVQVLNLTGKEPEVQIIQILNELIIFSGYDNISDSKCRTTSRNYLQSVSNILYSSNESNVLTFNSIDQLGRTAYFLSTRRSKVFPEILEILENIRKRLSDRLDLIVPLNLEPGIISSEPWYPRTSHFGNEGYQLIGLTTEVGLSGPGTPFLGFTIEVWVWIGGGSYSVIFQTVGDVGGVEGSCPFLLIEGHRVIFGGSGGLKLKSPRLSYKTWNHIAITSKARNIILYCNGYVHDANAYFHGISGQSLLLMNRCPINSEAKISEFRIWSRERSRHEILSTISISIPPSRVDDYPSLRYSWIPLRVNGRCNPLGSLLFHTWTRSPIGRRIQGKTPFPVDSRWLTSIPTVFSHPYESSAMVDNITEFSEARETAELTTVRALPPPIPSMTYSQFDCHAQAAANALVAATPGLWYPRCVSLPPGLVVSLGNSDDLGLTGPDGFTIETWVFVTTPATFDPKDNGIVGYGMGAKTTPGESFSFTIRDMKLFVSFCENDLTGITTIPVMEWVHVAVVYDGKEQLLYVNGRLDGRRAAPPLKGVCALSIGGFEKDVRYLNGDLCEFRLWQKPLLKSDIIEKMRISISAKDASKHKKLRLCWFPLRYGGPYAHHIWKCQLKVVAEAHSLAFISVGPPLPSPDLINPLATLFWDVHNNRDCGFLPRGAVLPATRSRCTLVRDITAQLQPPSWFLSQLAAIDEWSDAYDRVYMPNIWPPTPPPTIPSGDVWIPRIISLHYSLNNSLATNSNRILVGTSGEFGFDQIGRGFVAFTLELWIRTHGTNLHEAEDIFGHVDSETKKGLISKLRKTKALRLGLWAGKPYISLGGDAKTNLKNIIISDKKLRAGEWSHLAFICSPDNTWKIIVNGKLSVERRLEKPLKVEPDTKLYLFGYTDSECHSDICEMRLWTIERSELDIRKLMHVGLLPLSPYGDRIPGLRLSWLPLKTRNSLLFDVLFQVFRAQISMSTTVITTRRPAALPPLIRGTIHSLPRPSVTDDLGDAFEAFFLPYLFEAQIFQASVPTAVPIQVQLPEPGGKLRQGVEAIFVCPAGADRWLPSEVMWGRCNGSHWVQLSQSARYQRHDTFMIAGMYCYYGGFMYGCSSGIDTQSSGDAEGRVAPDDAALADSQFGDASMIAGNSNATDSYGGEFDNWDVVSNGDNAYIGYGNGGSGGGGGDGGGGGGDGGDGGGDGDGGDGDGGGGDGGGGGGD